MGAVMFIHPAATGAGGSAIDGLAVLLVIVFICGGMAISYFRMRRREGDRNG